MIEAFWLSACALHVNAYSHLAAASQSLFVQTTSCSSAQSQLWVVAELYLQYEPLPLGRRLLVSETQSSPPVERYATSDSQLRLFDPCPGPFMSLEPMCFGQELLGHGTYLGGCRKRGLPLIRLSYSFEWDSDLAAKLHVGSNRVFAQLLLEEVLSVTGPGPCIRILVIGYQPNIRRIYHGAQLVVCIPLVSSNDSDMINHPFLLTYVIRQGKSTSLPPFCSLLVSREFFILFWCFSSQYVGLACNELHNVQEKSETREVLHISSK